MLSLRTLPYLHHPILPLKTFLAPSSHPPLCSPRSPPFPPLSHLSAAASFSVTAKMAPISTVEHVVLFKARESTDPSKIDAMMANLRALTSLGLASYLTAVPILRLRSATASALGFTHLLHSRYPSKTDLATYAAHPAHQAVVKDNVLTVCDDIMAVDWVANLDGPAAPSPGSAVRLTLAKPREGGAGELHAAVAGIAGSVPAAVQVSYGENFSPARAKDYTVGFLSVFPGVEELDAIEKDGGDLIEAQKEKVRPLLENIIVVDYVVPPPTSACL